MLTLSGDMVVLSGCRPTADGAVDERIGDIEAILAEAMSIDRA
jgi:hypothetical protein